jgi:hypothetical protein
VNRVSLCRVTDDTSPVTAAVVLTVRPRRASSAKVEIDTGPVHEDRVDARRQSNVNGRMRKWGALCSRGVGRNVDANGGAVAGAIVDRHSLARRQGAVADKHEQSLDANAFPNDSEIKAKLTGRLAARDSGAVDQLGAIAHNIVLKFLGLRQHGGADDEDEEKKQHFVVNCVLFVFVCRRTHFV